MTETRSGLNRTLAVNLMGQARKPVQDDTVVRPELVSVGDDGPRAPVTGFFGETLESIKTTDKGVHLSLLRLSGILFQTARRGSLFTGIEMFTA